MDKFNLKEYLAKNPLLNEGPVEDFEQEEFEAHSTSLEEPISPERHDILDNIDKLNHYLKGSIPKDELIRSLIELVGELKR